jgi:asparagine synthase (glutamine-hydrolysing)
MLMKISGEKVSNSIRAFSNAGEAYRDTQTSISRHDLSKILEHQDYSPSCNSIFSAGNAKARDIVEVISRADYYGFMQRVLRKVDMMSMINSVEVRVPYLCNSVIKSATYYQPNIRS